MKIDISVEELAQLVRLIPQASTPVSALSAQPPASHTDQAPGPAPVQVPPVVRDRPSPEGLGGQAGWGPPTAPGGLVANAHANPLLGHSGLAEHGLTLSSLPSGVAGTDAEILFRARVSPALADETWRLFCSTLGEWLQGWQETQEVEVEIDEAMVGPDGQFVVEPGPTKHSPGQVKRHLVKRMRTEPVPQPDRVELLRKMGTGRFPPALLQLARQAKGLQALVWRALTEIGWPASAATRDQKIELAQAVAGSMVQISHAVFPDLQVVYDQTESCAWTQSIGETA
jgi:hypothetical protein